MAAAKALFDAYEIGPTDDGQRALDIAMSDVRTNGDITGPYRQKLERFGKNILSNKNDPAILAWGRADKAVAKALAQVDDERLKYINALLKHMGIANDDFARSALATLIGLPEVSSKTQATRAYDSLVDTVLSLQ